MGMEAALDALAVFLAGYSAGTDPKPNAVQWVLGDIGMGKPQSLPFGYIAPFNDEVRPYSTGGTAAGSRGVDMERYTVPLLIIDDLHQYSIPTAVAGQQYLEQPGYRDLIRLTQNIKTAVRSDITLGGVLATSTVTEIRYVRVEIGDSIYRAARLTVQMQQRVAR